MDHTYFNDPLHGRLQFHYIEKSYGGYSLVFSREWMDRNLTPQWNPEDNDNKFNIYLHDAQDGKVYPTRLYTCYESHQEEVPDQDWNFHELESLQGYFYGSHHCQCHRKSHALAAGAVVEDDECEGERFTIHSITCDRNPGLVLYSETFSLEQLEEMLCSPTR